MSVERANPVARPRALVERYLRDPSAVATLTTDTGALSKEDVLSKCARDLRGYDLMERGAYFHLLLQQVVHNPHEGVRRGALELLRIPKPSALPEFGVIRSLQAVTEELVQKPEVTALDIELLWSTVDHTSDILPADVKKKIANTLKDLRDSTAGSQNGNVLDMFSQKTRSMMAVVAEDRKPALQVVPDCVDVEEGVVHELPVTNPPLALVKPTPPAPDTPSFSNEQRGELVAQMQRQCIHLTPPQLEAKVVELRNQGFFKNFEIQRIVGIPEGQFRTLIGKLIAEGKIQSQQKKSHDA